MPSHGQEDLLTCLFNDASASSGVSLGEWATGCAIVSAVESFLARGSRIGSLPDGDNCPEEGIANRDRVGISFRGKLWSSDVWLALRGRTMDGLAGKRGQPGGNWNYLELVFVAFRGTSAAGTDQRHCEEAAGTDPARLR